MYKTIGQVPRNEVNRYWQFPLLKDKSESNMRKLLVKGFWFIHLTGIMVYSLCLYVYLSLRYGRTKATGEAYEALKTYKEFLDIYPTSVYPLIIKTFELIYYRHYSLNEPSLELGTGDGYFTNKLYKDKKLTIASDMTGSTLLQAKDYKFYRKLAIVDAMHIPLPDKCLNTVIMNNLIHHLPDRTDSLKEVGRVLKPEGMFIFTDEYTGWATSQWHVRFNTKHLNGFLKQTIQCLLEDKQFWIDKAAEDGWEIWEIEEFFSNDSMYWASVLETLNRKIGSPTPEPIRKILNQIPVLKKIQLFLTSRIAEMMIINDVALCRKYGATCVFIAMRKKSSEGAENKPSFACPICKSELVMMEHASHCFKCGMAYPKFKDIPFLIPYFDKLPAKELFDAMDKQPTREVSC